MDPDLRRIREHRVQYQTDGIDVGDLHPEPIEQWRRWHADAVELGVAEPNTMILSTVDLHGAPDARAVLVRGAGPRGLVFFTNYASRKGRDLAEVPRASLAFWWPLLERQVRVDGAVERLAPAASDAYFASRPYGSQIGAWASPQSEPIAGREALAREAERLRARYPEGQVPRPEAWGGYRLGPTRMEFWQGRDDRLHDRFEYLLDEDSWRYRRLAP